MAINSKLSTGTLLNGGDGLDLTGDFYGAADAPVNTETNTTSSTLLGDTTTNMGEMTITADKPTTPSIPSIADILNLNPMDILQPVAPAEDNIPEMTITGDKPVTPPPVIDTITPTTPPPAPPAEPDVPEVTITGDKPVKPDTLPPIDPIVPTDPNDIVHHDVIPAEDPSVPPEPPPEPPVIPPVTPTTPTTPNVPKEDNSYNVYTANTSSTLLKAPSYTNNPNELQAAADNVAQRMTRGRTSTLLTGGRGEDESQLVTSKLLLGR